MRVIDRKVSDDMNNLKNVLNAKKQQNDAMKNNEKGVV